MSPSRRALSQLLQAAAARGSRSAEAPRCVSPPSSSLAPFSTSTSTSSAPRSFETALAVVTCGNGDHGRLGHGGVSSASHFTLVLGGGLGAFSSSSESSLAATQPVDVAAGGAHTLVLTADGAVLSFGLNDAGQLGHSEGAAFVTVPVSFSFGGKVV